ncbi:Gep5p [Saccharomyces paradoxus]|uniref:Genetic interactor of prohibitin 5, mitochondrial n=1 Tax=Saccharomyces paradoxus TaxID=27291 RepID=A0A8B8UVS2_SACPA|nr:Gep5 [Saccharomyces paradoxus]QHS74833.1 Gep5 [Saccharomyces paradoxus]
MVSQVNALLLPIIKSTPLHQITKTALVTTLTGIQSDYKFKEIAVPLTESLQVYEKAQRRQNLRASLKALESIIYQTHFQWNNPRPRHALLFQKHYHFLLTHWPFENHRHLADSISTNNGKLSSTSSRGTWLKSDWTTLFKVKNPWVQTPPSLGHPGGADLDTFTPERTFLINSLGNHYKFLIANSHLSYNHKKYPSPGVQIPIRNALGEVSPAKQIAQLFARQLAHIYTSLFVENPPLSPANELELMAVFHDESLDRRLRRLYMRACARAYSITNADSATEPLTFHCTRWED